MTVFSNLNKSSRLLAMLLSVVSLFAVSMFLWLGMAERNSINEMSHIINSDLKEMESETAKITKRLSNNNTLHTEIHSHAIKSIENSRMIHAIILFAIFLIALSWVITIIHIKRLKLIKAREEQLEELLYYHEVNKIHESFARKEDFLSPIMELQLNRDTFFSELNDALRNNQFILHYQPIVNSVTGRIAGVEALIRWQHPVHGLLLPGSFLPLCENSEFMISLGDWILKTACQQIKEWQRVGFLKLGMSINISALQLNDPKLLSSITGILQANELSPDSLKLEITESSLMKDMNNSVEILQSISNLGLQLSLDDFGTGYSSMQYLKRLPVSNLKIDAMFIKDMSTNITSLGIVESIITLGKSLGLSITAEGVENKNQLHILKRLDCDFVQGYFYSKPVAADELIKLIQSENKVAETTIVDLVQEQKNYRYDVLKEEYFEQAVNVITHSFCEYEPMTKYLGITSAEFTPFAKILVKKAIKDGLSIVALDNNKVAACTIVEDIANPFDINMDIDRRFKIIFSLLEYLGNEFFRERAMYKGHIAHLFITAVDKDYHGQGLSRKINFESIRLAKERGFDFMCCEFTHDFNEKGTVIHLKNSRLLIKSCKYREFIYNGKKPFAELDGHASAYIWELREGAKLRYKINA